MHFNDFREMMESDSLENEKLDFKWELENCPTVHTGFTTGTSQKPEWNVLYLSMWFGRGVYVVRLNDRETEMVAYIELDTLNNFFENIESKLKSGRTTFRNARAGGGKLDQ